MILPDYIPEIAELPSGTVLSSPFRISIESDLSGDVFVKIKMGTRHFCTALPLNERISHRHSLEWLVVSAGTGQIITVISQSDHSYQHMDFFVTLPADRNLVLVPNSPYIFDTDPVLDINVNHSGMGRHSYRYEVELGASSDSNIVKDKWSYREGHLPFMHWFHNKAFRWAFDGASLTLPIVKNKLARISINALCRTTVEVWASNTRIGIFNPISSSSRWHDEGYGVILPAELATDDTVTLEFRFARNAVNAIDFNLRQPSFAVSRMIVDLFDVDDAGLFNRIACASWSDVQNIGRKSIIDQLNDKGHHHHTAQMAIVISDIEFELLNVFFSGHSSFWNTVRGLDCACIRNGVSVNLHSTKTLPEHDAYEATILAPIRFDTTEAITKAKISKHIDAAFLAPTSFNLAIFGLETNDSLLDKFSYREIYDVPFDGGIFGNFWEILPQPIVQWKESLLFAHDATIIGRQEDSNILWLATASAEDWLEMGDPGSQYVLDRFVSSVLASNYAWTQAGSCTFTIVEDEKLVVTATDRRMLLRSFGGGIARGWAPISTDFSSYSDQLLSVNFDISKFPKKGFLATKLAGFARNAIDIKINSNSSQVLRFEGNA